LALIATTGYAFSFWQVMMSRTGYRVSVFPPFVILTAYLFWRGWQRRSPWYFGGAGIALGLSQYTYSTARLLPLAFALYALAWTILHLKRPLSQHGVRGEGSAGTPLSPSWESTACPRLSRVSLLGRGLGGEGLWPGLLVMASASLVIFLPLGLFFLKNPIAFSYRAGSVSIFNEYFQSVSLSGHLLEALHAFVGGSDPNWRHNLVGRPSFDGLTIAGALLGLPVAASRFRQPAYLFLLVSLFVLWLPAPLSYPAIHALRLSGLLPFYYTLMAVGLLSLARWIARGLTALRKAPGGQSTANLASLAVFAMVFVVSGGFTSYNYFVRWGNEPLVYLNCDGPLTDLVRNLLAQSRANDVLLPFTTYVHPTTRFLLYKEFREVATPPTLAPHRPAILVQQPGIDSSAYVWLTRDEAGHGVAYVPPPPQPDQLAALQREREKIPFLNRYTAETVAQLTPLASAEPLLSSLPNWPSLSLIDYDWGHQVRLVGYQVWPAWVKPGQPIVLNLYWHGLTDQPGEYKTFVQVVNGHSEPLVQGDGHFLSEQYRWRQGGMVPDQYLLWIGPETPPGDYLVRMGLFNPDSSARVAVYSPSGETLGNQISLGLFYVTSSDADPRLPHTPSPARLGEHIQLLGYSLPPSQADAALLRVQLHWQADGQVAADYTIFVQLLNAQDQLVTSWDAQPLSGQYPTSRWQTGEIVVDEFALPLPEELPSGHYRLVAGMYDLATGQRLPATGDDGQRLPGDMIVLLQTQWSRGAQ
jgi:hypothetical protein